MRLEMTTKERTEFGMGLEELPDGEPAPVIEEHDLEGVLAILDGYAPTRYWANELMPVEVAEAPAGLVPEARCVGVVVEWVDEGALWRAARRAANAILLDREADLWAALAAPAPRYGAGVPWWSEGAAPAEDLRGRGCKHAWMNPTVLRRLLAQYPAFGARDEVMGVVSIGERISMAANEDPLMPIVHVVAEKRLDDEDEIVWALRNAVVFADPGTGKTWRQPQANGHGWAVEERRLGDASPSERSLLVFSMTEAVELPRRYPVLEVVGETGN
jgi:hypothetical protein